MESTRTPALEALGVMLYERQSLVELVQDLRTDSVQHLLGEDSQQRPGKVQGVEDGSVLVSTSGNEVLLELLQELQRQLVLVGQGLLTDDGLHGSSISTNGVLGVQSVGHITVVLSGHALTDSGLHQTGQRWQNVDGWVHTSVRQLTVDENSALGNVTGQIGNRVSDVIVRHGQDRNSGDGTVSALDSAGSLVDGGQIRVHVTGVTSSTGHLFSGGGNLSQGVGVGGHIGQDGQHVSLGSVGQVLGGGQGQSWRNDSLNSRVVGQVQEQRSSVQGTVLLEISLEKSGGFQVDTHGGEHNGEVIFVTVVHVLGRSHQTSSSTDSGSNLVVGQTGGRENGDLLTSGNGVHGVDGGNTGRDHFLWVDTSKGVDGRTVDVQVVLGKDLGTLVDRTTGTIEHTAQHVLGDGDLQVLTGEFHTGLLDINTGSTFENSDNGLGASDFQDSAGSHGAVRQGQVDDLVEAGELDIVQDNQRTIDTSHGVVVDSGLDLEALGDGLLVQFEQFFVRQHFDGGFRSWCAWKGGAEKCYQGFDV